MSYGKPLPRLDTLNKPFWAAAKQGQLLLQHCPACGDTRFPPGLFARNVSAGDQAWVESFGQRHAEVLDRHAPRILGRF